MQGLGCDLQRIKDYQRELWVDNVKVVACILVVLGHFFQSLVKAEILPANNLYGWFNQTIYYFHVPLFFICSGYLYQKLSKVNDVHSWIKNVSKKLVVLGIPYFTFSFVTWILKTVFSSSVNSEIGGLQDTLFLHPTAPYWYLYALFFLFFVTPTFSNKVMAMIGLIISLLFKIFTFLGIDYNIQVVSYFLSNEIWFVIGMCVGIFDIKKYITKRTLVIPSVGGILFLVASMLVYTLNIQQSITSFALGLWACCTIVMISIILCENRRQNTVFGILAKYTMPIFLMHTLFAAPLRTILCKIGIQNAVVHVVLGAAVSFIGPIVAAVIMERSKWLEIVLYPGKFFQSKSRGLL